MSALSWEQFRDEIATRVPRLAEGDVIILGSGRRYTQLMQRRNGVTVEAVSNSGLPPEQQLRTQQEDQLRAKGWQPPNGPLRHNWWLDVDQWPLHRRDALRIAELMLSTLRDVYDVNDPAQIEEASFKAHQ